MFTPEPKVKIWLYSQPVDMRKSFNGLSALVTNQLQEDPLSGELFVFINRRKTHIKVLYFDGAGYCIWFKRLEQGQFNHRLSGTDKHALDWARLKLLLDGLEVKKIRQYRRYSQAA
ncbi:MAG: IS66 family insertion sequence element accessory protein TnpB [Ketobacter sp.]|jgi:transposase